MAAAVKQVRLPVEVVTLIVDALLSDVSHESRETSVSALSSLALVCRLFRHIVNFVRFNAISLKVWVCPNVTPRRDRVSQLTALLDTDTKVWEGGKDREGIRSTVAQHIKNLTLEVIIVSDDGYEYDLRSLIPILSKTFLPQSWTWKPSQYKSLDLYQLEPTVSLKFSIWGEDEWEAVKWTDINSNFTRFFKHFLRSSTVRSFFIQNCTHVPRSLLHNVAFTSLALYDVGIEDRSPMINVDPRPWNTLILVLDERSCIGLSRTIAQVKKLVVLSEENLDDIFFPGTPTPSEVETLCVRVLSDTKKESLFVDTYSDIMASEVQFCNVRSMLLDSTLCRSDDYYGPRYPFTLPIVSGVEQLEYQFSINILGHVKHNEIVAYVSELFSQYDTVAVSEHVSSSLKRPTSRLSHVILHFYISFALFSNTSADEERRLRAELGDLVSRSFPCLHAAQKKKQKKKLTLTVNFTIDDDGESICRKRSADSAGFFRK